MGSGFESQGAHIKKDPADSSESAGFLRSPRKRLEKLGGIDISPCSYRGPVLAELGHPDVAAGNIYTPACLWFRGSWNPAGFCGGIAVVQYVRPVPSELGWGRLSLFSVLLGGLAFCMWGRGGLSRFSVLHGGWMFGLVRRVFRKRPQGVTRTLSAAKQGGAERPGHGFPCVGAEETCGVAASTHTQ